jgi:LAO/AO transport system kinase
VTKDGIENLWSLIRRHFESTRSSGELRETVRNRVCMELMEMVEDELRRHLWGYLNQNGSLNGLLDDLADRKADPYTESRKLVERFLNIKNNKH